MYKIMTDLCSFCGLCVDVCPVGAISELGIFKINVDLCTACGLCAEDCPSKAIRFIEKVEKATTKTS